MYISEKSVPHFIEVCLCMVPCSVVNLVFLNGNVRINPHRKDWREIFSPKTNRTRASKQGATSPWEILHWSLQRLRCVDLQCLHLLFTFPSLRGRVSFLLSIPSSNKRLSHYHHNNDDCITSSIYENVPWGLADDSIFDNECVDSIAGWKHDSPASLDQYRETIRRVPSVW